MIRKKTEGGDRVIDLTGPQGNAFFLMGTASNTAKQLGWTKENIDAMIRDMQSSDYEHLLQVFEDNFGELFILER